MSWQRILHSTSWICGGLALGLALETKAQTTSPPAPARLPSRQKAADLMPAMQAIVQALATNPVTAPYAFAVEPRDGRVLLRGRVGTKQIHDVAIRLVTALGYPFTDELVIDTATSYRSLAGQAPAGGPAGRPGGFVNGVVGPIITSPRGLNSYIYPPPLFGRYDDPFFGLEPPVITYPPWWRGVVGRQPLDPRFEYPMGPVGSILPQADAPKQGPSPAPTPTPTATPTSGSQGNAPPEGTVEMTINPQGVAVLRGTVPSLEDRVALGQRLALTPGVSEVQNLLNVREASPAATAPSPTPPPPPTPEPAPDRPPAIQPDTDAVAPARPADANPQPSAARPPIEAIEAGRGDLLARSLARRPALAGLAIKASLHEGVATLKGKVPSVYEAMLAFRAAQQTPGVRQVDDLLEFVVPDAETKNPLLDKARPEDLEPYLEAQIRRQVGDQAHVDRIRVNGNRVEIHGTLAQPDDKDRVDAILRSMPVLRGFHLDPVFRTE